MVNKQDGSFDRDDLALVEMLAASAAAAIDNARLVAALRQYGIELEARNQDLKGSYIIVSDDNDARGKGEAYARPKRLRTDEN
jgi:GAF domain-containing protein